METESISIKVDGLTEKDWVKINDEQHGFYRVHYAPSLLKLLLLDIQNLSTPNRYGIFNDVRILLCIYSLVIGILVGQWLSRIFESAN